MKVTKKKIFKIKTKKGFFSITLQKWEGDRDYVVRVPAYPEIVTHGTNIEEAKTMAREAIELCIACGEEENKHGYHSNLKSKRSHSVTTSTRV